MRGFTAIVVGLVMGLVGSFAYAADDVVQTVGHGQINWTDGVITATGSGAPNLKAANVAVARLGAERSAKLDAFRNILETVRGARISGAGDVSALLGTSPQLQSQIQGMVRNFRVNDTKYYSDGGVDVIVSIPLNGVLFGTLVPATGTKVTPATGPSGTTGIVIQAKGLKVVPALAPRIVDPDGNDVFSAAFVSAASARAQGVVAYVNSLDAAMKHSRVADKPLIIKAQKLVAPGSSDLVVSEADAGRIRTLGAVVAAGKVIIVTD